MKKKKTKIDKDNSEKKNKENKKKSYGETP
jgi:hypothetical protein